MGAALTYDIADHLIDVIPLEDHMTASAVSCIGSEYVSLFARFLRSNGLIDARAGRDRLEPGDRVHGTVAADIDHRMRFIVERNLRAYVFGARRWQNTYKMTMRYQFSFGRIISWECSDDLGRCQCTTTVRSGDISFIVICDWYIHPSVSIRLADDPGDNPGCTMIYNMNRWEFLGGFGRETQRFMESWFMLCGTSRLLKYQLFVVDECKKRHDARLEQMNKRLHNACEDEDNTDSIDKTN
jgi:hypothetical protein